MENNGKGTNIFLGVIGVATLIVAIIGATFAFFGAEITGGEGNLATSSTTLALGYSDDITGLKTALIPAEYWIADYAAKDETHIGQYGQCIDTNNNQVCSVYDFTIGNPNKTTAQTLHASINAVTNGFTDLFFRIYEISNEDGTTLTEVVGPTRMPAEGQSKPLEALTQILEPSKNDSGELSVDAPEDYTLVTKENNDGTKQYNRKTYRMVMWIEETKTNQTEGNAGKSFAGSIYFTTAQGDTGVTGVIGLAQKPSEDDPDDPVEEDEDLTALEDELLTLLPELLTADAVERVELPLVTVFEEVRGADVRDKVLEEVMVRPDVRVAEATARVGFPGRYIPLWW